MAMHVLDAEPEDVARLVDAINAVRGRVRHCDICGNLTEEDECSICRDVRRDPSAICVVQEPKDIQAIEGARVFRGRHHVLGGVIDPIHGVRPDQLNIASLMSRLADGSVTESSGDQPERRRRGDGLPGAHALHDGGRDLAPGDGPAHGRRPGVRRLGDAGPRTRGTPPPLSLYRRGRDLRRSSRCGPRVPLLVTHV